MDWRPFATAPKDGSWFLAATPFGLDRKWAFCSWRPQDCPSGWHLYGPFGDWCDSGMLSTYWAPLPEPPDPA